jgi:hypothetical protein
MFISVPHLVSGIYSEPCLNGTFNIIRYRFAVRWYSNHGYFLITFRLLFIILTYFVLTETYISLDI